MTTHRVACLGAFLSVVFLALAGCGGQGGVEGYAVSGKVTIDGEPIPQGSVTFIAADGATPTGGGTITDGVYTAPSVPPGEKIVLVLGTKVVGQEPSLAGVPDSAPRDVVETVTPPAYNAASATPLKASITGPQQDLNFDLTKDVPPPPGAAPKY